MKWILDVENGNIEITIGTIYIVKRNIENESEEMIPSQLEYNFALEISPCILFNWPIK